MNAHIGHCKCVHKILISIFMLFITLVGCTSPNQLTEPLETITSTDLTELPDTSETQRAEDVLRIEISSLLGGDRGLWVEFFQDGLPCHRFYVLSFANLFGGAQLEPTDHPPLLETAQYVRFHDIDESMELVVYPGTEDIVCLIQNGVESWFSSNSQDISGYVLYDLLMLNLTGKLRNSYGRLTLSFNGSAEQVMETYASSAYPEYAEKTAQFTQYGFADYQVLAWEVNETAPDWIEGSISYAVRYENPQLAAGLIIDGGTEHPGTGAYEGWYIVERRVILEKHGDGIWCEVDNNDFLAATSEAGGEMQSTLEEVADAEEFLLSLDQEVQNLGTDVSELPKLAELFLRTARAVSITDRTDFDWTWMCTEDAMSYLGMRSLMKRPTVFYGGFEPEFIYVEGDTAFVYHYEAVIYFRQIDGKWKVEDIVRPFVGT